MPKCYKFSFKLIKLTIFMSLIWINLSNKKIRWLEGQINYIGPYLKDDGISSSEHGWRTLHYNVLSHIHRNVATKVRDSWHVKVHLVVNFILGLLIKLHQLIRLILHYLMILVRISELIRCTAKSVLINLIIVLKPYVICIDVNVHLVWKIMV